MTPRLNLFENKLRQGRRGRRGIRGAAEPGRRLAGGHRVQHGRAAALALAEEGTRLADAHTGVSDETSARVREHYDDDQLVALVAQINAANRLAVIVHQRGGAYAPGMFADLTG
jgi:alkylhydroperoxidase family enzyme